MYSFNVIKLDAISSTNDYLKQRHHDGLAKDEDLCWASYQKHGRGQFQNKWIAGSGKNLTFSVYKRFHSFSVRESFLLNAAVCSALIHAISDLGLSDTKVKWPNDIMSANKKLGGVLIENMIHSNQIIASVIGIGLNVNQTQFERLPHAGSLKLILGKRIPIEEVLRHVLFQLRRVFDSFSKGEREPFLADYNAILWKCKQRHLFHTKDQSFLASIEEVDYNGQAQILQSNRTIKAYSFGALKMSYSD